jgi:SAM-dependent methyltransferase
MREGLEARRSLAGAQFDGASASLNHETRNALSASAELATLPPLARPGPFAWAIRFSRTVIRGLLRPWLAVQTQYNRLALEVLDDLHREVQQLKGWVGDGYGGAVNRELGPDGQIARSGLWFNPPVAVQIQNRQAEVVSVSERILETIFVHTRLPPAPARVLDLGCVESTNPVEMAGLGYQVVGIDLRPHPIPHPAFAMVLGDAARLPFPDASFDVVISLSTIEHVGLDWYGRAPEGSGDFRTAAEIHRVLRPGGRLTMTVPFGQTEQTPVQRIYDRKRLDSLLRPFKRVETLYGRRDGLAWTVCTDASCVEDVRSLDRVNAVALVVAEKS